MTEVPMTADEAKWRARDDAHALAQAEEIKADPKRLDAAKGAARQMVEEETERLVGLKKAAGRPAPSSTPQRGNQRTTGISAPAGKGAKPGPRTQPSNFNVFRKI